MEPSFQQRRQGIVGDCRQLKTDVESYNDNQNKGELIQLILDFTDDMAEYEALKAVAWQGVNRRSTSRTLGPLRCRRGIGIWTRRARH
jgi:hypothetical protein